MKEEEKHVKWSIVKRGVSGCSIFESKVRKTEAMAGQKEGRCSVICCQIDRARKTRRRL